MRTLYLLRHSLTEANERHLYGGSTDSPLTPAGRALAEARRRETPLPEAVLYASSGMARAEETLRLLTGHAPDLTLPGLREMAFGTFEMRGYDELKDDPAYVCWIEDQTGAIACPCGESANAFRARVLDAGSQLLARHEDSAVVVCHGGVIVNLMQAWFPGEDRSFYEWQPAACRGYRIVVTDGTATDFEAI